MFPFRRIFVNDRHIAIAFDREQAIELLEAGVHWRFDLARRRHEISFSTREAWRTDDGDLPLVRRTGLLDERVTWLELPEHERAFIWADGRLLGIARPGLHMLWTHEQQITIERHDTRNFNLEHDALERILEQGNASADIESLVVPEGQCALLFVDGVFRERLDPGRHAFWKASARLRLMPIDLREQSLEVSGQEIMTQDRVTLRINLDLTFRVTDPLTMLRQVPDVSRAIYRDAQLVLRTLVGTRTLEQLLVDKHAIANELIEHLSTRAQSFGVETCRAGIRDIVLPGDIRELMNKVMEARQTAEASSILRREEVASMRSRANAARMLDDNPSLLRLRELELVEKIAESGQLNVSLDDRGLRERIVNMI